MPVAQRGSIWRLAEHRLAALGFAGFGAGATAAVPLLRDAVSPTWGALTVALVWGLWTLVAIAGALPWLVGTISPWSRRHRRAITADDPPPAAWVFSLLLCAAAAAWIALRIAGHAGERVAPDSRLSVTVGCTLGFAALCAAGAPILASCLARIGRPSFVRLLLPLAGGILAATAAVIVSRAEPRFVPIVVGLGAAGLAYLPTRWLQHLGSALAVTALVALAISLQATVDAPPAALRGPAPNSLMLGVAVDVLETWSDGDGDGYGDQFGGSDCDDSNADIHPAAVDIPSNGIDENCRGGDAEPGFKRHSLPSGKRTKKRDGRNEPPHIILLVLDAVRADHFGSDRNLTPNLDKIARQGTAFTRAFAPSSTTRMSIPALLTGRWIGHTRYREKTGMYYLDDQTHTLAVALAEKSYRTAAVLPPFIHGRMVGLNQGFGKYISFADRKALRAAKGRTAPLAVAECLKVLEGTHPFPLFLYVHIDDAHAPYSRTGVTRPSDDGSPATRYAGEIVRMDSDLVPLLERIQALGEHRPVLLAITADHGEAFGAHGSFHHGRDLYHPVLHVPLVLVGPGVPAGKTIDTPVDLLDLGVTLAKAGRTRLRDAQGQTLWGLLQGRKPKQVRSIFAELRILHAPYPVYTAIIEWPYKLIHRADTDESALYNLADDPGELLDLSADAPETQAAMSDRLLRWSEAGVQPAGEFLQKGAAR